MRAGVKTDQLKTRIPRMDTDSNSCESVKSVSNPKVVAEINDAVGAAIGAADLAAWSGVPLREARAWLAEMSHTKRGRRRFTTIPWLAEWLAANVKNRPRITHFDPLQKTVGTLAAWTVGELVRQGVLVIGKLPKSSTEVNEGNEGACARPPTQTPASLSSFASVQNPNPQPEAA